MDKIVCLGKNYEAHARELGDAVPEMPVLFLKPPSVLQEAKRSGDSLEVTLPGDIGAIHHECEIVLRLERGGYRMTEAEALLSIGAVSVGLDMTARDKQTSLKKQGHPWEVSKVFIDSAVVGPWVMVADFPNYLTEPFSLTIDGALRQKSTASEMTLSPARAVAYASQFFPLLPGDLVFTGTPEGVGPVRPGQKAELRFGPVVFSVHWNAFRD